MATKIKEKMLPKLEKAFYLFNNANYFRAFVVAKGNFSFKFPKAKDGINSATIFMENDSHYAYGIKFFIEKRTKDKRTKTQVAEFGCLNNTYQLVEMFTSVTGIEVVDVDNHYFDEPATREILNFCKCSCAHLLVCHENEACQCFAKTICCSKSKVEVAYNNGRENGYSDGHYNGKEAGYEHGYDERDRLHADYVSWPY